MANDFRVDKGQVTPQQNNNEVQQNANGGGGKIIDEANYRIHAPREIGPTAIGRGGDPLFRGISATKAQLDELNKETADIQNWVNRQDSNDVAKNCLKNNGDLKDIYYEIKDGFGEYGKISLMGFKTPQGVEIPRLKIYDKNGEVLQVLTGPMAIDELNKRALAYKESKYEALPMQEENSGVIEDYSGNPEDYIT